MFVHAVRQIRSNAAANIVIFVQERNVDTDAVIAMHARKESLILTLNEVLISPMINENFTIGKRIFRGTLKALEVSVVE
jgi:hypothetical protein